MTDAKIPDGDPRALTVDCKHCHATGKRSFNGALMDCTNCRGTGRQPMPLNPWLPMIDAIDVKHLGKLGEECSELATSIFRCIIQGLDEREPVTGKINRIWLTEEIADTLANIFLVCQHFTLDGNAINERHDRKVKHLRAWHALADNRLSEQLRLAEQRGYERWLAESSARPIPIRIVSPGDPR